MTNLIAAEYVFTITINKKWKLIMQVKYPPIQNTEILNAICHWCWMNELETKEQDLSSK